MLTIKDLTASKELDRKAMADVAGGMTEMAAGIAFPAIVANLFSPVNQPKEAHLAGFAGALTGPQFNSNVQNDNDTNLVIGSGQVVNTGGNFNTTDQYAYAWADNYVSNVQ